MADAAENLDAAADPVVDADANAAPAADDSAVIDPLSLVPDDPAGYELQHDNPEESALVSKWFKDANLTKGQAAKLAELRAAALADYQAKQAEAETNRQAQIADQVKADDVALKKEWGDKYDANLELGRRAVRQFEVTPDVLEAIEEKVGYGKMLRMFAKIGAGLGEDSAAGLTASPQTRSDMSPEKKLFPSMN